MRRFHAYCAGAGRSGTHSLAKMFQGRYRSAHDPDARKLIGIIMSAERGILRREEMAEWVRAQDKRLELEFNSSQLNRWIADILAEEFPSSKFILTIRDCYTWLGSLMNFSLSESCSAEWVRFRDFRFKKDEYRYAEEEEMLARHGLYTLDGYLSYWTEHNLKVIESVPKERLLVLRTNEIADRIEEIADFIGIPPGTLDANKAHSNRLDTDFGVIRKIDKNFLESKVDMHCGKLMNEYFPGFKNPF